MKILALDQSSNILGYAYFNGEDLIKYDTVDFSKGGKLIDRIILIIQWLDWFRSKHEVDLIICEDVLLQNEAKYRKGKDYQELYPDEEEHDNIITFSSLMKLLGIIEYYCVRNKIKYIIKKPSEWRSACGISGTKRYIVKQNAIDFVKNKWSIEAKEDTCEAICIGWSEIKPITYTNAWGNFSN